MHELCPNMAKVFQTALFFKKAAFGLGIYMRSMVMILIIFYRNLHLKVKLMQINGAETEIPILQLTIKQMQWNTYMYNVASFTLRVLSSISK